MPYFLPNETKRGVAFRFALIAFMDNGLRVLSLTILSMLPIVSSIYKTIGGKGKNKTV